MMMEIFANVLKGIGVDQTVFVQLALFGTIVFFLKFFLFDYLLKILLHREEETDGKLRAANQIAQETQKAEEEYNKKFQLACDQIQEKIFIEKVKIGSNDYQRILEAEENHAKKITVEINKFKEQIKQEKIKIWKKIDEVAQTIIDRLAG